MGYQRRFGKRKEGNQQDNFEKRPKRKLKPKKEKYKRNWELPQEEDENEFQTSE